MRIFITFFFKTIRRILWAVIVGFMIAWHNVYHEEVMLTEETNIEVSVNEEDREKEVERIE